MEALMEAFCTLYTHGTVRLPARLVGLFSQPFNDLSLDVLLPEDIASNFFQRLMNGLHPGAHVDVCEELFHLVIFEFRGEIAGRLADDLVHGERALAEQVENGVPVLANELPDQRPSDHVARHVDDHLCGVLWLDLIFVKRVSQELIQQPRISRLTERLQ